MRLRNIFILLLLLLGGEAAVAAVSTGYYRVKSYNDKYLTENITNHTLVCLDLASSTNYAQVWYLTVSGSNVTLKNALTDRYVQGSTTVYQQWETTTSQNTFSYAESSSVYTFANSDSWGMHCDASNVIVVWYTSDDKSKWTLEAISVDNTALNEQKTGLAEATTAQLLNVFTDLSCSTLKNGYTTEQVNALPSATQTLVAKMKDNTWATYSGWDKTEKTFRIADYKAYSKSSLWASIIGYGHSLGRLSNPTGIWVNSGDIIQVYVGTVPSGETVALEVAGYGQANGTTYTLHEGMNALMMASSGNCFVYYEVDNTTSGAAPYTPLSNYADVTVHIEGGTVQGYFDLTKGDDDDDWPYFKEKLMSAEMFCLKTKTLVFNLQTEALKHAVDEADGGSTGKVVGMLNYWQSIQDMEDELFHRASIGGENYAYCNNVHSVTTVGSSGDGSLYASTYGIYFSPEQHDRLFNYDLFRLGSDNLWASAHELGHHRQAAINMVGCTEVSNNIYSNVAVYRQGRYTSRTASIKDVFSDYINGISWPERVQRANNSVGNYNAHLLHLNWSLYMFFHLNGKDTNFFPKLFDALRADPMSKVGGSDKLTPANTDYLKYYVKCCQVSGYNLTDFFASYGFFLLPPEQETSITYNGVTTNRYQSFNDYADYNLYVTQDMIDDAKAEVADMSGLKKCNIVFIEDRVTAPLATYDGHAEGELKAVNSNAPVTAFGQVGEMGQYTDFDAPCSAYSFNVSARGNVTMEGSGAVGFIVYDNSGNIVGFYNTKTFHLPSAAYDENGLKRGYSIKAAAGDGTTAAATYDSSIEVNEFPKTGVWYTFCTPLRGGRIMQSNGAGEGVVGSESATITTAMQWKFVERDGETEVFDIINRADGSYLSPSASSNTQIVTSASQPSAGWQIEDAATDGLYIVYSSSVQLNQTNYEGTNGYKIYNWGGGSNTTDVGCQFLIEEVKELSSTALDELADLNVSVASSAAGNLETGQWYVMFDRGANHGYLYENVTTHTLYNTATAPAGSTSEAGKYLVRLIDAGDGNYYLQTGYGNYFWRFESSVNVPTTSQRSERIAINKINSSDGHFYLQSKNNSVVLDANDLRNGDATVVGYGTTVPTSTGGNNDWAFYPVTLTRQVALNVVGDASYATLYLPYDVTTDEDTKAYYITEVADGRVQLTELTGGEIAAKTAVVLINDNKASNATLTVTSGLSQQVSKNDNLLKGTLTSMDLDLSDASSYYSLGRLGGEIGFYKFTDGTITLGANKAYLDTTTPTGQVKGFRLWQGGTVGIDEIANGNSVDGKWYDLSGRRTMKPTRGLYIVNGKKVVVK